MKSVIRCSLFALVSLLFIFSGPVTYAMTQADFNALVKNKGLDEAVVQAAQEKMSIEDIARMTSDPELKESKSCLLVAVVSQALAQGIKPLAILQMLQKVEGLNPIVILAAMARSGISEQDLRDAATAEKISDLVVNKSIAVAKVPCNISNEDETTQAYTAADQPDIRPTPIDPFPNPDPPYVSPSKF